MGTLAHLEAAQEVQWACDGTVRRRAAELEEGAVAEFRESLHRVRDEHALVLMTDAIIDLIMHRYFF